MPRRKRVRQRRLDERLRNRVGDRRSVAPNNRFSAAEQISAVTIATPTRTHNHGRLRVKPEIASAIASQTNPKEPAYDSASKTGSSSATLWSTTQLWTDRSSSPSG